MIKLKLTYLPVDELVPYERNSRTHSAEQVQQVVASMKEFGFTNPILIDGAKGIVAGHCRLQAARQLGLKEVPTIDLAHLTPNQRRAYVISDNKLAENAGWEFDTLKFEMQELNADGFDMGVIGFDETALANLLDTSSAGGATDEDDAPPAPDNPVSQLRDVWIMGAHRIVCGDSTDADTVALCLNGVKPHLMVTDPPYGVDYKADWRGSKKNADGSALSTGANRAKGRVENDDKADWREAWALFPGEVTYVWHSDLMLSEVVSSLEAAGFERRAFIVWAKNALVVGRGHYHWQHETCGYFVRKGGKGHWTGDRKQSTLWHIDKPRASETGHSTQKPVECMQRPIENNSSPGQAIYEPFSGSGTTIIACEQTGRACHAIELSPAYVDVAVKRWQAFTEETAYLASTGQSFSEVEDERS